MYAKFLLKYKLYSEKCINRGTLYFSFTALLHFSIFYKKSELLLLLEVTEMQILIKGNSRKCHPTKIFV